MTTPQTPTEADGRLALRDHLLDKARAARVKHPNFRTREGVLALLDDRDAVRYPTGLRFDAGPLQPGEFAWAMPLGEHPREGYCLIVHPQFEHQPETWATLLAYYIPPINYGDIVTPEDCEAFGGELLGLDPDSYYSMLCDLADSIPGQVPSRNRDMKQTHPWHETFFGRIALWLGSIQLAVPVLVLMAAALAWGTWLDSTKGAKVAKAVVYGSWWFIALMGLVCLSLIFAVVTRYPWKRRHVGFITVHAGLLALIFGGFWSMFGRVEGQVGLEEGNASGFIELDHDQLELAEHNGAQFRTLGAIETPGTGKAATMGAVPVQIVDHWSNTSEVQEVHDDSPMAFRGVQVQLGSVEQSAVWVGQENPDGSGSENFMGLTIRVLADGENWTPPGAQPAPATPAPQGGSGYYFLVDSKRVELPEEGKELFPGWTVTTIKKFTRATVGADGLEDNAASPENPAIEVTLTSTSGTVERHTAFPKFPEMPMSKTLSGAGKSGARLVAEGGASPAAAAAAPTGETLVVFGPISATRVGYVSPQGASRVIDVPATLPATLDLGQRKVILRQQFAHARGGVKFVQAPEADERRPALVVKVGDNPEPVVAAWKAMTPVNVGGKDLILRYGPATFPLPFSIRLEQFRKTDYPGTEMAMAYESDVSISYAGGQDQKFRIYMNSPYAAGGWKVYQSGFMGEHVSVFSVMRDPGLPLTYIGAVVLCVGILLTFYSRSFSWGHPGIPVATLTKESADVPPAAPSAPAARPVRAGVPAGAGV